MGLLSDQGMLPSEKEARIYRALRESCHCLTPVCSNSSKHLEEQGQEGRVGGSGDQRVELEGWKATFLECQ